MALSGCLASEVPDLIVNDQFARARESLDWFRQVFGPENYYLELQNHGLTEQAKVNRQLVAWAREFGLKLVATNDVHYLAREHSRAHDCLICIGTQTTLEDTRRLRYAPEQFHLRPAPEMQALFAEVPEAIRNTLEVAEKCSLKLQVDSESLHYPVFQPPEHFTREGYLRHLVGRGPATPLHAAGARGGDEFIVEGLGDPTRLAHLRRRTGGGRIVHPPARAAARYLAASGRAARVKAHHGPLQHELAVIERTGFVSYFLIRR